MQQSSFALAGVGRICLIRGGGQNRPKPKSRLVQLQPHEMKTTSIFWICTIALASADASATVETPFGMIEGNHLPVLGVNEYLSLPYAQPPTGTSRFGPPIDWSGPLPSSAKAFGPSCPQVADQIW